MNFIKFFMLLSAICGRPPVPRECSGCAARRKLNEAVKQAYCLTVCYPADKQPVYRVLASLAGALIASLETDRK